jgi:hypothetical protein
MSQAYFDYVPTDYETFVDAQYDVARYEAVEEECRAICNDPKRDPTLVAKIVATRLFQIVLSMPPDHHANATQIIEEGTEYLIFNAFPPGVLGMAFLAYIRSAPLHWRSIAIRYGFLYQLSLTVTALAWLPVAELHRLAGFVRYIWHERDGTEQFSDEHLEAIAEICGPELFNVPTEVGDNAAGSPHPLMCP